MSACFACEPFSEDSDVLCPKCRAVIAQMEAEYAAQLARRVGDGWEDLEPHLSAHLANQVAERLAVEQPHWQQRLVTGS